MKGCISIGSNKENAFILEGDSSISNFHAKLCVDDNEKQVLVDENSTNGVFVNDHRIMKKEINQSDQIQFGNYVLTDVEKERLFNSLKEYRNDFSTEFLLINERLGEFHAKKKKVIEGTNYQGYIKIGISIIFILFLVFFGNIIPDPNVRYALIVVVSMIPLIPSLITKKRSKSEKLDELRLEYEEDLYCPKCGLSLMEKTLVYWNKKSNCPKCGSKWR